MRFVFYSSNDYHEQLKTMSWQQLNRAYADDYQTLFSFIDLLLTIPASTAVCERGFSAMKRIKSDHRASLTTQTI